MKYSSILKDIRLLKISKLAKARSATLISALALKESLLEIFLTFAMSLSIIVNPLQFSSHRIMLFFTRAPLHQSIPFCVNCPMALRGSGS
jgi:hypothetical protein